MKVILKQNVPNLGETGDVVKVKDGYARNFLVPSGLASVYTDGAQRMLDNIQNMQNRKILRKEKQYQELLDQVKGKNFTVSMKAGENGKLFGTVTLQTITETLTAAGISIDKKYLVMKHHINKLGEYTVVCKFTKGFEVPFTVTVENERNA